MASPLSALISALQLLQRENCSLVAATTFIAYDIFHTFSDEVRYIWMAKWSFPKVLYIMARYYGLVYLSVNIYINVNYNIPLHVFVICKGYYWFWILFGDILFTTLVNMLFSLRMYALFGGNKRVLAFFIGLCVAEYGTEFYTCFISARDAARTAFVPPPGVPLPGCFTVGLPRRLTLIAWIPNITVNSLFFLTSLAKLMTWSGNRGLLLNADRGPGRELFAVFLRDGTVFYLVTMSSVVVNMATALTGDGSSNVLTSSWLIAAYSFAGAHIVLNLRNAAAKGVKGTNASTFGSETANGNSIRFRNGVESDLPRVPHRRPTNSIGTHELDDEA